MNTAPITEYRENEKEKNKCPTTIVPILAG
jgi:hypothetical protein